MLKLSIYPFKQYKHSTIPSLTNLGGDDIKSLLTLGSKGGQAMHELILFITDFDIFLF